MHELDAVATFVWERCDGRRTGWQLVSELVEAFEVGRDEAATDVAALLDDLALKGIVEWHEVSL